MKSNFDILKEVTHNQVMLDDKIQQLEQAKGSIRKNQTLQKLLQEDYKIDQLIKQAEGNIEKARDWKGRFLARQKKNELQKLNRIEKSIHNLEEGYDIFSDIADKFKSDIMYAMIEKRMQETHFENEDAREKWMEAVRLALLNYFLRKNPWCRTEIVQKKIDAASRQPEIQALLNQADEWLAQELYKDDKDKHVGKKNEPVNVPESKFDSANLFSKNRKGNRAVAKNSKQQTSVTQKLLFHNKSAGL